MPGIGDYLFEGRVRPKEALMWNNVAANLRYGQQPTKNGDVVDKVE